MRIPLVDNQLNKLEGPITVEVKDIDFSEMGLDNVETSLIYLRNLGFEYHLDFTDIDYATKEHYINYYLSKECVDTYNEELVMTVLSIICNHNFKKSILTNEELIKYRTENKGLVNVISSFVYSLPLFCLLRFKIDENKALDFLDWSDVIHTDEVVGINMYNVIKNPNSVHCCNAISDLKFFDRYYTEENNVLFDACKHLPYFPLLMGLAQTESSDWDEFRKDVDNLDNIHNTNQ